MKATLRVVDTGLNSARWNIAMSAALSELHLTRSTPDTLRLHFYPRSVLIGRHQTLDHVIDRRACAARGIEIARRITGGGAVYMAPGVLAWDLVMARSALGSLPHASETICGAVASALFRMGFAARFRAPGDVIIDGRKVSGSAGCHDGGTLTHQGTVLIDVDLDEMAEVLGLPSDRSASLSVAALCTLAGHAPASAAVSAAVSLAIGEAFGRSLVADAVSERELAVANRLLEEEIGTQAFVEHGNVDDDLVRSAIANPVA
jgi:lipoate-protein ligase A